MASSDVLRRLPALPNPDEPDAAGAGGAARAGGAAAGPVDPPRGPAPRPLRSVTPGSLAAGVLATGQDTRLGLERLPARRE